MSCHIIIYTVQLTLPDARYGHSVTAISLAPGLTEVTMFGGTNYHYCIAATTIISFGESNPYMSWGSDFTKPPYQVLYT